MRSPTDEEVRLRIQCVPRTVSGCWLWTGKLNPKGYGFIAHKHRRYMAHRLAYLLFIGPIPEGKQIDHVCHTADDECTDGKSCVHRRCVNPFHLEPVTSYENSLRGRGNASKTHCRHGHLFDEWNTIHAARSGRKGRTCRTCRIEGSRRRRAARKSGVGCGEALAPDLRGASVQTTVLAQPRGAPGRPPVAPGARQHPTNREEK